MTQAVDIRDSRASDLAAIERLYPEAFPDEDLLPLVRELLQAGPGVLSLVAVADGVLAGHVAFTSCTVAGRADTVALLGPLAVAPDRQRQGIGGALVRAGLERLEAAGTARVYVLGDPTYYSRFGFTPDGLVAPPYLLPEEWRGAWQSLSLGDGQQPAGALVVPPLWRQPTLWGP